MSFTIYHIVFSVLIGYLIGCLFKNKEGFEGTYSESQDQSGANLDIDECAIYNGSTASSIDKGILQGNKCAFKNLDCGMAMTRLDDNHWSWLGEDESISKQNCKLCIQGSELENTLIRNIANISHDFAGHYCDALYAGCENHSLYSNSKDNWSEKCDTIANKTNIQEAVCTIDNPGLQWILNAINSPMCDLNIEALIVQRSFTNAISDIGDFFENANPFG